MKTRNSLLTLIFTGFVMLSMLSCKKKGLELYDEAANGSSIYFKEAISSKIQLQKNVSFGYVGYSVMDSVLAIPVAVTGYPSTEDRTFQLTITNATTAISGTHYSFLRPPVIRAGRVVDTLLLKINRTADMALKQYEINLLLEQNGVFTTSLVDTSKIYLKYKILLDDIAGVSYLWTTYSRAAAIVNYFGVYSRRKVDLMIEVLKLNPSFFYDPAAGTITTTQILSFSRYMYYWLNKEAAEGREYLDENGVVIKMGQYAN